MVDQNGKIQIIDFNHSIFEKDSSKITKEGYSDIGTEKYIAIEIEEKTGPITFAADIYSTAIFFAKIVRIFFKFYLKNIN